MKIYSFNGYAGCVVLRKARSTGTMVGLYNGEQADLDTDGGESPWSIVCEAHGTVISHQSRKLAESHLSSPQDWCEDCGGRSVPMSDRDILNDLAVGDDAKSVVHRMETGDFRQVDGMIAKLTEGAFRTAVIRVMAEIRARFAKFGG